jgi:hypothetical protein
MIETAHFYESFFRETEVLLAEVAQRLRSVAIECAEHDALELTANDLELINADTVMTNYLRMIEVTLALEGLLDKIRNNDIAFNGYINSLVEATAVLHQWHLQYPTPNHFIFIYRLLLIILTIIFHDF